MTTMKTTVVNINRDESFDVFCGRPSRWGNPFKIGKDGTREAVIAKYIGWFQTQPELVRDLWLLGGKRLGCFCAPKACHCDWLAMIANVAELCVEISQWKIDLGLRGIWDPFCPPPKDLREHELGFLFDDGAQMVGSRRRVKLNGELKFDTPSCSPIIKDDWAVAWRKISP